MTVADSSQARISGKADGQVLLARWWLWSPSLDAQTLLHFKHTKVWVEDNRDAAVSFLPTAYFLCAFMPLCLELTTGFSQL